MKRPNVQDLAHQGSGALWAALIAALLALCMYSAPSNAQDRSAAKCVPPCSIDLGGTWRFLPGNLLGANQADPASRQPEGQWKDIRVPANWHLEGYDIAGVAWYRREINVPLLPSNARALLRFEGVDYFSDVWLNGFYLGSHEGYFEPFAFDASSALRPGRRNEIVVRVDSPIEHPSNWSLSKRLIKGIFSHHDTRPGGAWSVRGQEHNTGGIWNDVTLQIASDVVLDEPRVRTRVDSNSRPAQAMLTLNTWSLPKSGAQTLDLDVEFIPHNFSGPTLREHHELSVEPGRGEHSVSVSLAGAQLWWPSELGQPNLYRVRTTLRSAERVLDRSETVTGLRDVRVDTNNLTWHVNGKRLFLRGTNYIPTQWLAEMDRSDYQRDVAMMQRAHVNAVRVHAHVGDRRFYRACDEAGLLVWQDFPLQWGYVDSAEFGDEAKRQAVAMVRTLDNHPSVIAWSMHNEPPWDAWWMKYKYPDYDPNQNRLLDDQLERVVRAADDSRYVHKASLSGEHHWQGWYSGHWTDFNKPTTHALVTEFGAQALPGVASLRRLFNNDNLFPDTDKKLEVWRYHNFQPEETFKNAKIDKGKNIHEFVANSQRYQSRLIQLAAESLRRQKYRPVGAIFQFMFVEDWPSMNWGVVDYWRIPKPGYEAMARAYQPLLPSIEWEKDEQAAGSKPRFGLWLVNDHSRAFDSLTYTWELRCDENLLDQGRFGASVEADAATRLRYIETPALPKGRCTLRVSVLAADGKTWSVNAHEFIVL